MADKMDITPGAKLTVSRPGDYRQARFRRFRVLIDGVEEGKLTRMRTLSFTLAPGRHLVQVLLGRSGTPEVEVHLEPGQCKKLSVEPDPTWYRTPGLRKLFSSQGWLRLVEV